MGSYADFMISTLKEDYNVRVEKKGAIYIAYDKDDIAMAMSSNIDVIVEAVILLNNYFKDYGGIK